MAVAPVIVSPVVGEYVNGSVTGNGEGSLTERQCVQTLAGLGIQFPAQAVTGAAANDVSIWNVAPLISNGFSRLQALLSVSAAAQTSGDTLDVFIDASPDNGVTWYNVVHFTQVLGNGGAVAFIARTPAASAGSVSNVTVDLAAGNASVPFSGNAVRVRNTRVNGSGSLGFTFGVTLILLP